MDLYTTQPPEAILARIQQKLPLSMCQTRVPGWAFWHSGDNPGFKNFALAYPQARIGLVIMTNGDGGTELWEPLLHLCLRGEYPLFAWRAQNH